MSSTAIHTLGIDIGSTTVKVAVLSPDKELLFSDYRRHYANIQETLSALIAEATEQLGELSVSPVITGSGGLTLANHLEIPFVQEVIAVASSLDTFSRRPMSRLSSAAKTPRSSTSKAATSNSV